MAKKVNTRIAPHIKIIDGKRWTRVGMFKYKTDAKKSVKRTKKSNPSIRLRIIKNLFYTHSGRFRYVVYGRNQ